MFTGIVEEVGKIVSINQQGLKSQITLTGHLVLEDLKLGDSLAVNGVCLTVSKLIHQTIQLDVMEETLTKTTLGQLKSGHSVNLERAMPAMGRFGGHYVSGHVDAIGKISDLKKLPGSILMTVEIHEKWLNYMVEKGSITIDGVSLTLIKVERKSNSVGHVTIGLIPHTQHVTTLFEKTIGNSLNIEVDLLAKYIEKWIQHSPQAGLTEHRLAALGY